MAGGWYLSQQQTNGEGGGGGRGRGERRKERDTPTQPSPATVACHHYKKLTSPSDLQPRHNHANTPYRQANHAACTIAPRTNRHPAARRLPPTTQAASPPTYNHAQRRPHALPPGQPRGHPHAHAPTVTRRTSPATTYSSHITTHIQPCRTRCRPNTARHHHAPTPPTTTTLPSTNHHLPPVPAAVAATTCSSHVTTPTNPHNRAATHLRQANQRPPRTYCQADHAAPPPTNHYPPTRHPPPLARRPVLLHPPTQHRGHFTNAHNHADHQSPMAPVSLTATELNNNNNNGLGRRNAPEP